MAISPVSAAFFDEPTTVLVLGTTYQRSPGEEPLAWQDAYYRRLLREELPETVEFIAGREELRGALLFSLTLASEEKVPGFDESASEFHQHPYQPGRLKTVFTPDLDVVMPRHRIRLAQPAAVDMFQREPSTHEIYEIVGDIYLEHEMELQALYMEHLDAYAAHLRNIILEDFFLEDLAIFALVRTRVSFTKDYASEVRETVREYQRLQGVKHEKTQGNGVPS